MGGLIFISLMALSAAVAAAATGSNRQRWTAMAASLIGLASPWLVPREQVGWRCLLALSACVMAMKVLELVVDRSGLSGAARVGHLFTFYDLRTAPRNEPEVSLPMVGRGLLWLLLASAAFWAASPGSPAGDALRCLSLLAGLYCVLEIADGLIRAAYLGLGIETAPTQAAPIRSRSLTEFWGRRWNRVVHRWLFRHLFAPLARRGRPVAGVAAAFTVSALVHAYPVAVVSSWVEPAMVLGFFLAHAVLVLVERRIHVNGWPPAAGRAWTLACFVLTGPLLALPLLHLWDGGAP